MSGTVNTAVEMANLALAHLKEAPIRDFDFSSVASRWFRNHYAAHRDAYLAMHDWDFAIELVNLPAETEKPPFRWAYQYKLPAGTLRIPQQSVGGSPGGTIIPFEVVERPTDKLATGGRVLAQRGVPGFRVTIFRVVRRGGALVRE